MRVIEPIEVDDDVLVSTTAQDDDTDAYDDGTTYDKGDVVVVDDRRYESVIDDNDAYPPDNTPAEVGIDEAKWLDLGATNKWRPFDELIASQCVGDGDLELTIEPPSAITAIAFFRFGNVTSVEIEIEEKNDDDEWETVWTREESLIDNSEVYDAWTYAYTPIQYQSDAVFTDLPTVIVDARLHIRIRADGDGDAKVGQIVMGRQIDLGVTTYGTEVGIEDWSVVERDQYGNATLRRRRYSDRVRYDVWMQAGDEHRIRDRLASYRARPTVYIGSGERPETVVFGVYRDFNITLSSPAHSRADIEVEGMT